MSARLEVFGQASTPAVAVTGDRPPPDPSQALCVATLQNVACACLDAIGLVRQLHDDDDGLLNRLLEARLQLLGMEVSRVLKAVAGEDVVCEVDSWLLSPRELDMVRSLEGNR